MANSMDMQGAIAKVSLWFFNYISMQPKTLFCKTEHQN
jgi:hypothetical protein